MNGQNSSDEVSGLHTLAAEFDAVADQYDEQHAKNIAVSGEKPAYFAEHKIASLAQLVHELGHDTSDILDFGSGIGNSLPFLRAYFPGARLSCADISARSIELSRKRFPGTESYVQIGTGIPLPSASQDLVFSACVFHHIPHEAHLHWLTELLRVTRPRGLLAIYEHNPLNPLTVRAVDTCPFDANAQLIRGDVMRYRITSSGWMGSRIDYQVFFPSFLRAFRPLEARLGWLPLGAQYRVTARRPA
jgi:SAM-dependent methyltransferase